MAEAEGASHMAPVEVDKKVEVELDVEYKMIHPLYLRTSTAFTYVTRLGRSVLKIGIT